jgi:hypothetical protein
MTEYEKNNSELNKPLDIEDVLAFADPKQREIRDVLKKLDPSSPELSKGLSEIYEGLVITLNNKRHPDRIGQVGHSARELTSILPRYFQGIPLPENKKADKDLANGENQRAILTDLLNKHPDRSALPEYLKETFVRDWIDLHKFFNDCSKHGYLKGTKQSEIQEKEFEARVWKYEDLLYQILVEKTFFDGITEIDALLAVQNPSPDDLSNLTKYIAKPEHRRYFFQKCNNPNWLEHLKSINAFSTPQESLRENGYIRFIIWPESQYLARIANQKPQEVFDIIKNLNSTNQSVLHDFAISAIESSIEIATQYVDVICRDKWVENSYNLILPDKIADLMDILASAGNTKEALRLARALFDTKVDPPLQTSDESENPLSYIRYEARPHFDTWRFGEIMSKKLNGLKKNDPKGLFSVLSTKLRQAIELEKRINTDDSFYELSHIWRPDLASARSMSNEDAKNILLDGIINLIKECKDDESVLKEFIKILKTHPWALFRRLEVFTYLTNPSPFSVEIEAILSDPKIIVAYNLRREYLVLLEREYSTLSDIAKDGILKRIELGPDFKKPEDFTEDQFLRTKLDWKSLYLKAIQEHLPKKEKLEYSAIVEKYGERTDHDGQIVTWDGNQSPISSIDLSEFTAEDTIQYLADYKIPEDPFARHSSGGLGSVFAGLVSENPNKYVSVGNLFFDKKIRPIFFYHLTNGLKEAIKNGKEINWLSVIDVYHKIIVEVEYTSEAQNKDEQDWNSVQRAVSDFIGYVLGNNSCLIPTSLKEKIWAIILTLTADPEPTPEYENKNDGVDKDPMTLAINTTRGEAMHAVINYGLWIARNLEDKSVEVKMPIEITELLDKHLDISQDPSLAIRSVYGWRLPNIFYLNLPWLTKNKEKIFPKDNTDYLLAAWQGYLANNVIKELFTILKQEYYDFISHLGTMKDNGYRRDEIEERFPQQVMVIYANEFEHDDFVDHFFSNAPVKSRAEAINFAGRVILRELNTFENKDEVKKRFADLWDKRISLPISQINPEELQEFGWWFKVSPFDKKETLDRTIKTLELTEGKIDVAYEIAEELKSFAVEFPVETIKLLDLLIRPKRETWDYLYKKDEYKEVIKLVKSTGNDEAKKNADVLINYLMSEAGLTDDFRDLLE